MSLYARQRRYFEEAYKTGEHGWPVTEPTPFVVRSVKQLLRKKAFGKKGRVLDLGCGEGRHTFACAELGLQAVGLDYQRLAISRAQKMSKTGQIRRGYYFLVGDAFHLPFSEGSFDYRLRLPAPRKKKGHRSLLE